MVRSTRQRTAASSSASQGGKRRSSRPARRTLRPRRRRAIGRVLPVAAERLLQRAAWHAVAVASSSPRVSTSSSRRDSHKHPVADEAARGEGQSRRVQLVRHDLEPRAAPACQHLKTPAPSCELVTHVQHSSVSSRRRGRSREGAGLVDDRLDATRRSCASYFLRSSGRTSPCSALDGWRTPRPRAGLSGARRAARGEGWTERGGA